MGAAAPDERVRARRTQQPILPDDVSVLEIGHRSGRVDPSSQPLPTPSTGPVAGGSWSAADSSWRGSWPGSGSFVWTLSAFFSTDATLPADGRPHQVSVDTDGERVLWRDASLLDPVCTVVDLAIDEPVPLGPVGAQLTRDFGRGTFVAAYRFAPGLG